MLMPTLTNVTFPNHEIFNKTVKAIKESTATEVLIERAIGRAFLERLEGKPTDLLTAYAAMGGQDPIAKQLFSQMNDKFTAINLTGARAAVVIAANHGGVAASKSVSVHADNPVFKVDHTALNTLANLGGAEFAKKFNIQP
jgi:citrate lyase beta subunit